MDASKSLVSVPTPPSANLPHQALALLKAISTKEQDPNKPGGGVTYRYENSIVTGTFTFPLERQETPDGELVKVIDFTI